MQEELVKILAQMLENHELELTPIHTPPTEYASVEEAQSQITELFNNTLGKSVIDSDTECIECGYIVGQEAKQLRKDLRRKIME